MEERDSFREEPAEKSFSGVQVLALRRIFSHSLTHPPRGTSIFGDCSRKEAAAYAHSLRRAQEKVISYRLARSLALRETFQTQHALFIFHSHPLCSGVA
jgi:hypothetical protein